MRNNSDYEAKRDAYYRALSEFYEDRVEPALRERLDEALNPPFNFRRHGQRWESVGTDLSGHRADGAVVYCYANRSGGVYIGGGNNRSGANSTGRRALEVFKEISALKHFDEAVQRLAKILSLPDCPTWEEFGVQASEDAMRHRADCERAASILTEALQEDTPEAAAVRDYLHSRLTESEYNRAVESNFVGLASSASISRIKAEAPEAWKNYGITPGIGTTHTVAIISPYGSHNAEAFVFRCLPGTDVQKKYNYFTNAKRSTLLGLESTRSSVIVVEGEFDALKARLALAEANITGVCVVACGQNLITEERAKNAVKRGVRRFTIIPDNDDPGRSSLAASINNLFANGATNVYVSELEGEEKDTADYISAHGVEKWLGSVRDHTETATAYQARRAIQKYVDSTADKDGAACHELRGELIDTLRELATKTDRELNTAAEVAGILTTAYRQIEGLRSVINLDPSELQNYANNKKYADDIKRRDTAFSEAQEEAQRLTSEGRTREAAAAMADALRKFKSTDTRRYEHVKHLTPPDSVGIVESDLRRTPKCVHTNLCFRTEAGEMQAFDLKEGVTLLVGARKHGKTTMLLNFVFDEAMKNYNDFKSGRTDTLRKVLLFTYEVTKNSILQKLLSIYLNNTEYGRNSFRNIRSYYAGEGNFFAGETLKDFENRKGSFFERLIVSGAITIIEENYTAEEMIECTADFMHDNAVSFVAVDYIQELSSEERYTMRTEELKRIGMLLRTFANANGLPFLCAAQFNRIESLLDVDTRNIGEAGDLERNAVDVIGIFNLKELAAIRGTLSSYDYALCEDILTRWGVTGYCKELTILNDRGEGKRYKTLQPVYGKIYAKLLASRFDEAPAEVMLNFEGRTGVVDLKGSAAACDDAGKHKPDAIQQELPYP